MLDPIRPQAVALRDARRKPVSYIVLGKPGSGKTTLAKSLAAALNIELIDVTATLASVVAAAADEELRRNQPKLTEPADEEDGEGDDSDELPLEVSQSAREARELLLQGQSIPVDLAIRIVREKVESPACAFRGYVLDGLPLPVGSQDEHWSAAAQLAHVKSWTLAPQYIIELQLSDFDLDQRRCGFKMDPASGIRYSQYELSVPAPVAKPEETDEEAAAALIAQEEADERNAFKPTSFVGQFIILISLISCQTAPEPDFVPLDVKARLIQRPLDLSTAPFEALRQYKATCVEAVENFLASFHPQYRLEIAAHNAPSVVLAHVMEHIVVRNIPPITPPTILGPLGSSEFASEGEMISELTQHNLADETRPWNISSFSIYCPVALVDDRALIRGSPTLIVTYHGMIFVFASKENRQRFCQCPTKYISVVPQGPCRVSILASDGDPLAPQFAQALTEIFNASLLDMSSEIPADVKPDWVMINHVKSPQDVDQASATFKPLAYINLSNPNDPILNAAVQQLQASGVDVKDFTSYAQGPDALQSCINTFVAKANAPFAQVGLETIHELDEIQEDEDSGYGDYKNYCPVSLIDAGVLRLGSGDNAVKYEGRVYRLASSDARQLFVENPTKYVRDVLPVAPALRVILVGPTAAGKSTQARKLARRHRCFHISFQDRLREVAQTVTDQHTEEIRLFLSEPSENPLSSEAAVSVVQPFWTSEPYKSVGFILEGFPRNIEDVRLLAEKNLFADVCINAALTEEGAVKRRLPKLLSAFEKKRNVLLAEIETRAKARAEAKLKRYDEWKVQMLYDRAQRRAEQAATLEEGEDAPEEEPEPEYVEEEDEQVEEPEVESLEAAEERITQEIADVYNVESQAIAEVTNEWSNELRLPLVDVNCDRREEFVKQSFERALLPFTTYRANMFFTAQKITLRDAEGLLSSGFKQLSGFGTWCPNQLLHGKASQPTRTARYPVLYRDFVYFFASEDDRSAFFTNSTEILAQSPPPSAVPVRIAIVGPPKAGKTSLAETVCTKYGAVHVTIGRALRFVLESHSQLLLAENIREHLWTGDRVPDELCVDAVKLYISSAQARIWGYVFDGFPQTMEQVQLFSERLIIPHNIFHLNLPEAECIKRFHESENSPDAQLFNHSVAALKMQFARYSESIEAVRQWYVEQHRNWTDIAGHGSKWKVFLGAQVEFEKSMRQQQAYLRDIEANRPASVADLCLTPAELTARIGHFKTYCPVSWVDKERLVQTAPTNVTWALEYRGAYFYTADKSAHTAFLATPEKYWGAQLPAHLPVRKMGSDIKLAFPLQFAFQGFCPVSYVLGNHAYESLVPGDSGIVAEYTAKLYSFAAEDKLQAFLQAPQLYADVELPQKVPPRVEPMNITKLPMLGYMEQTCAAVITMAMTAVGLLKPKYPFLNATQSAQLYIALYLKACNPKSTEYSRSVYRKKLRAFEERCGLVSYLGHAMQPSPVAEKPVDLDYKLKQFFALARS